MAPLVVAMCSASGICGIIGVGPLGTLLGEFVLSKVVIVIETGMPGVKPENLSPKPSVVGVIVSVKCSIDLVLELSVNFSVNTSLMSCWTSGDRGASVWLMIPLEMLICSPAWLTTASGVSVCLSNRM